MAKWEKIAARGNVDDRRMFGPVAAGGIGITGVLIVLGINFLLGGDLQQGIELAQQLPAQQTNQQIANPQFQGMDDYELFASQVLGSNNQLWESKLGDEYTEPQLVLFRDSTNSACGGAVSQFGPHYCPIDQTIYLDETFFDELQNRFGAQGGDVAEAYVIAHEVGHHVQYLLGRLEQTRSQQTVNPDLQNELSVAQELQADCYAGIWANSIREQDILNPGEIKEAMDAAAAVGDDRIQQTTAGQINQETWTHGSSDQRVQWFTTGYQTGDIQACDTFNNS